MHFFPKNAEELTDYTYSVSISLNPYLLFLELLDRPCSANHFERSRYLEIVEEVASHS